MGCRHVDWSQRSLKVVLPNLKGFKSGKQFFVMDIVVEFGGREGAGMESNRPILIPIIIDFGIFQVCQNLLASQ